MAATRWSSTVPQQDAFGDTITDTFIDGRTRSGQWGIMTSASWQVYGVGQLGTGRGQRYARTAAGNWVKVEG